MPHGFQKTKKQKQKTKKCIKKDGDQVGSGSVKEGDDVRWTGL